MTAVCKMEKKRKREREREREKIVVSGQRALSSMMASVPTKD
jgi:hypothetical protein